MGGGGVLSTKDPMYEWAIFLQFYLNLNWLKSKKNPVILLKILRKIGPIGYEWATFSWKKKGICMGLLSKSMVAHPYQTQTWVPLSPPRGCMLVLLNVGPIGSTGGFFFCFCFCFVLFVCLFGCCCCFFFSVQ